MEKKSPSKDSLQLHRMEEKEKNKKKKKKELIAEKEAMERKVEELTRQLAEEKQTSRRALAKLQREVARLKSERTYAQRGESREALMKELDRERMLRVDTEHRLHDMRVESDSCRSRLQALHEEFRKMEEMVRNMQQFKVKIDQLKQEKTNLAATFEVNLQKSRSQIGELERENMMLLNQVKKLESQMNGKGNDQDKSKLLLQRLKMLEAEKSSLVLEIEQQRKQYEKCLDEIANQVVQALLAQKTLREDCMKLQSRVHDLEHQNRQLNYMFQHRLRCPNEQPVQSHAACVASVNVSPQEVKSTDPEAITAQHVTPPPAPPLHPHVQPLHNLPRQIHQASKQRGATPVYLENSTESIQSMCSDYMFDDSPGKPQMSSPPPWLKEKLDRQTDNRRSSRSSTESPSSVPSPTTSLSSNSPTTGTGPITHDPPMSQSSPALQTKIETEFPANNSSPKIKHVNVADSGCKSLDRSKQSGMKNASRLHKRVKNSSRSPVSSGSRSPGVQSKIPTSSKGTPVISANQIPPQRSCDIIKSNLTNQRSGTVPFMGKTVLSANQTLPQRSCDSLKSNVSNHRSGNITCDSTKTNVSNQKRGNICDSPNVSNQKKGNMCESPNVSNQRSGNITATSSPRVSSRGIPVLSANALPRQRSCDSPKESPKESNSHGVRRRSCDSASDGRNWTPEHRITESRIGTPGDRITESRIGTPGDRITDGQNGTPEHRITESRIGTPGDRITESRIGTPGDRITESRIGTPEHRIAGPKHSTPYDTSKLRHVQGPTREGSPRQDGCSSTPARHGAPFHSQYYYDYSDDDSDCRPVNPDCDTESTMSLNELLDNSTDGDVPLDDDFLSDWSPICLSPTNQKEYPPSMTPQGMFFNMSGGKPVVTIENRSGPYATIIVKEGRSKVVDEAYGIAGCRPLRPDNLILVPRDKQFSSCGFSSSSSSTEEAKSFLSVKSDNGESSKSDGISDKSSKVKNSEKIENFRIVNEENSRIVSEENSKIVNEENSRIVNEENSRIVNEENSRIVNAENSRTLSTDNSTIKSTDNSRMVNTEKSGGSSQASNTEIANENSKHLNSEKGFQNSDVLNSETVIENSEVLNTEKCIDNARGLNGENSRNSNGEQSSEKSKDLDVPVNDVSHLADIPHECAKVSSLDGCFPKTSTPVNESKSESKTKTGISKIPMMSPTSPKKAPPPIPKKPKFQKNMTCSNQLKLGPPTNKRNPQSKIPGVKQSVNSSSFSSVSKTTPTVSPKSVIPESEIQTCSVVENKSESESSRHTFISAVKIHPLKEPEIMNGLLHDQNALPCSVGQGESESSGQAFTSTVKLSPLRGPGSEKVNGLVLDKSGLPYLCENLTVERQRDLAAFLVQDVIERVKSQDIFYQQKCQSNSDTSFDSVRVERSGSKDDGYSTMSSDIQPEVLKDFADPVAKMDEGGTDSEKLAESALNKVKGQLQDFSSDPDSAMENSSHSCELRTSSHSLSSQVSSSSGEGILSPGHKVQNMKKFFEDTAKNMSHSEPGDQSVTTSPQSPMSNCHSELGKISKIPIFQTGVPLTTKLPQDGNECRIPVPQKPMQNQTTQPRAKEDSLNGDNCGDIFDSKTDRANLSEESCNSSEDDVSLKDGSVPATDIFYQDVSGSSMRDDSGLGHMTSLHISEEKILEDIPEDDEWEILHNKNVQEHFHNQYDHHTPQVAMKDSVSMETVRPLSTSSIGSITLTLSSSTSASMPCVCLIKAKSETELSSLHHPHTTSKYEDFLDGNWDSGKVPERSASVSEMDVRKPAEFDWLRTFRRKVIRLSVDENSVLCRVQSIINRLYTSQTSLSSDRTSGDLTATVNFLDRLSQKEKTPYNLPVWSPKETTEPLKNSSPSPVSSNKYNSGTTEDWLLQFSQPDIDHHSNSTQVHHCSLPRSGTGNIATNPSNRYHDDNTRTQDACETFSSNLVSGDSDTSGFGSQQNGVCSDGGVVDGGVVDGVVVDGAGDGCCQSPSEQQTRFNSRFYSLCPVGPDSKSSLFSNGSRDCDMNKLFGSDGASSKCRHASSTDSCESKQCGAIVCESKESTQIRDSFETKEFETISQQIADLSKTVSDLHHSLSSLNSDIGSNDDLRSYLPCLSARNSTGVLDGYHWEEEEIFMASCGGEVIIGSREMLSAGCSDWMNDSIESNGASCFFESGSGADVPEQFYEIQVNGGASCSNGRFPGDMNSTPSGMNSASGRISSDDKRACFYREKRASLNDACFEDPVERANMLDSMIASGCESNDSLASDIGLDHMMCQRLTGSTDANLHSTSGRLPLDFSKFFIRYGEQEKQAVAAFDFLDEFSTSNSESTSPKQLKQPDSNRQAEVDSPPAICPSVSPSVCVLDCRIDASGRVRKIDKSRRKKRADERKEQKQRENSARSILPRYSCEHSRSNISSDSGEFLAGEDISLSDSCHESSSSSSPTYNTVTML